MLKLTEPERKELLKILGSRIPRSVQASDCRSLEEISIMEKVRNLPHKVVK